MKATLSFNLPDESDDWEIHNNALQTYLGLEEFKEYLRGKLKYENLSDEEYQLFEAVRTKLFECLNRD